MRISDWSSDVCSSDLYFVFGESCGPGFQQGSSDVNIVLGALELGKISADNLLINLVGIADRLGKGDLIVHDTLSAFGNHCNPMVSAETAMMVKEYIGDHYGPVRFAIGRSEEHTSELQSLMRISYAVFCLKKKTKKQ